MPHETLHIYIFCILYDARNLVQKLLSQVCNVEKNIDAYTACIIVAFSQRSHVEYVSIATICSFFFF